MQDLQHYDLICLDCKVPINELDLRMYENLSKRLSPGGPKSMCFAATGRLQGWAAKLLRARRKSRYSENLVVICLAANGPAIWGGCVTRRSIRAGSWYFSQKAVTVQGGYGALFAVRVQILLNITSVAVQG
jgi:hypothetical protein